MNSVLPGYSNLEYQQIDVSLAANYNFSDALYGVAKVAYQQFTDNEPYVYGDQDGDMYSGNIGVGYKF